MLPKNFPGLPAGWKTEIETFQSADGLVTLCWQKHNAPSDRPKTGRALLILHGMGEHGGRYLHFTSFLQKEFDAIYCLDHRGHGRSGGIRGHVERFDSLADDVAAAVKRIQAKEIHLFGHSMGGEVAIRALFLHPALPLASATLSAPLLAIKVQVPAAKKLAAKLLNRVWGSLQLPTALDPAMLSHDPEVVQCYQQDRLVHDKMTPAFFNGLTAAMEDSLSRRKGMLVPVQFLVPLEDRLVDPQTTIRFFEALEHPAKRLKTYPEFFHESMNEIGKEKFFDDVRDWVLKNSR